MNLKYLLCIILILIPGGISYSQVNPSNISIIDRLINESLTPVENKFTVLGNDKIYEIDIDDKTDEGAFMLSSLRQRFGNNKLIINEHSDSADYKLVINDPLFRVAYKKVFTDDILGTKKVKREVSVSYDVRMTDLKNPAVILDQKIRKADSGNFDLDMLGSVESGSYRFVRGTLPEESVFDRIVTPAAIIGVSAAAIILFFIIRSK